MGSDFVTTVFSFPITVVVFIVGAMFFFVGISGGPVTLVSELDKGSRLLFSILGALLIPGSVSLFLFVSDKMKEQPKVRNAMVILCVLVAFALGVSSWWIIGRTATQTADAAQTPFPTSLAPETVSTAQPLARGSPTRPIIYSCPKYKETGKANSLTMDIDIPSGQIAFIEAHGFDDRRGGFFITVVGPYQGEHTIIDGAFCSGINADTDYALLEEQRRKECVSCQEVFLPAKPVTPEQAAFIFGGPPASDWKLCPRESGSCWMFEYTGTSRRVSVPENCLRQDGSIDGWRHNGGFPGEPDSIQGSVRLWNALEGATIRCR